MQDVPAADQSADDPVTANQAPAVQALAKEQNGAAVQTNQHPQLAGGKSDQFIISPAVITAAIRGKVPVADGGYGVVYKATIDGDPVAIKLPTEKGMLLVERTPHYCQAPCMLLGHAFCQMISRRMDLAVDNHRLAMDTYCSHASLYCPCCSCGGRLLTPQLH